MAAVTPWLAACIAIVPALGLCVAASCRGAPGARLIAAQLAATVTMLLMVLMTFASDQPSLIDLPLALALLSLPGGVLFAIFLERWL